MANKKILIIDDDRDIRLALNARLRAHGYETAFAQDGATAVSIARNEAPALILLDLGLPAGDGFLLLERFRINTELSAIPVIVLTARDAAENERRALKAGAAAFFQNPADDDELMDAIARFTGAEPA